MNLNKVVLFLLLLFSITACTHSPILDPFYKEPKKKAPPSVEEIMAMTTELIVISCDRFGRFRVNGVVWYCFKSSDLNQVEKAL